MLHPVPVRPPNPLRGLCYDIVESEGIKPHFENFILVHIILNTLLMCMPFAGMTPDYADALDRFDTYFAVVFTVEAVLKISALGPSPNPPVSRALFASFDPIRPVSL